MNVVEEKIDALNAVLRVQISPEDYAQKVEDTLKNYRKQANLPGFRQGKTPMGLIKKKYGKAVLAEELNKAVNKSLGEFIQINNISVLGNPIPKEDEEVKGDFDNPADFEFAYEIGISPTFDLKLSKKNKFDFLKVLVDDEMLDKEVDNLARRYGKLISEETVGERDMIMGEFAQIDGDIRNNSTISMEFIEDKATKKKLEGAKVGDVIELDPVKVSRGESDMAAMLGISKEDAAVIASNFNFTITDIKRMIPAEINQELFDKLFGDGTVQSEEELRTRIKDDLEKMFVNDSNRVFNQQMVDALVETTKVELPEAFLKKWIRLTAKEEITSEQIEADFDNYKKSLKWQLIQNKIIRENDLKVEPQEAIDYTKGLLVSQYTQYGMPAPADDQLDMQAKNVLSNQEEANRIYDSLYADKIMNYIKGEITVNEKALPYEKFIEQAYKQ